MATNIGVDEPDTMTAGSKTEQYEIEHAQHNLNRINIEQLSKDAITWKSKATLRLAVVIMIQGLSMSKIVLPKCVFTAAH